MERISRIIEEIKNGKKEIKGVPLKCFGKSLLNVGVLPFAAALDVLKVFWFELINAGYIGICYLVALKFNILALFLVAPMFLGNLMLLLHLPEFYLYSKILLFEEYGSALKDDIEDLVDNVDYMVSSLKDNHKLQKNINKLEQLNYYNTSDISLIEECKSLLSRNGVDTSELVNLFKHSKRQIIATQETTNSGSSFIPTKNKGLSLKLVKKNEPQE